MSSLQCPLFLPSQEYATPKTARLPFICPVNAPYGRFSGRAFIDMLLVEDNEGFGGEGKRNESDQKMSAV